MKKEAFILLFLLFTLLIFYTEPSNPNLTYFGCTQAPEQPNQNNEQIPQEGCYLADNPEAVSGYRKFPAEFKYLGFVQDWEFEARGPASVNLYVPKIILGQQRTSSVIYIKQPPSTPSCEYNTFFFKREGGTSTFNIPYVSFEQISPTQKVCHFEITNEMRNFITEQTLGISLFSAKTDIPNEITAFENSDNSVGNNSQTTALTGEEITSTNCQESYEQKLAFTDSQGNSFKHCVKKSQFSQGSEYITDSYIQTETGSEVICEKGDGYAKSGQEFASQDGNLHYICIKKTQSQTISNLILNAEISTGDCSTGFQSSSDQITLATDSKIKHCIKRMNPIIAEYQYEAKTISPASGFIQICPEINGKDITDLDICRAGGTYPCEVTIQEGQQELYAFTVERDGCGNILIQEDNEGNPITGGDYTERVQAFIAECTQRQEEAQSPEEKECSDENPNANILKVTTKDGLENLVVRNLETASFNVKTDDEINSLACKLEKSPEVEFQDPIDATPNGIPTTDDFELEFGDAEQLSAGSCDDLKWTPNIPESMFFSDRVILQDTLFSLNTCSEINIYPGLNKDITICSSKPSTKYGRGEDICEMSCNDFITKLKSLNSDSENTIDINGVIENTWDIKHEKFPNSKDIELEITMQTENMDVSTGVPEKLSITIRIASSKRDFPNLYCLVYGADGDKMPFIDFREKIIDKVEGALPSYEKFYGEPLPEDPKLGQLFNHLGELWFKPEKSYRIWSTSELQRIIEEIDVNWAIDDSVWIEEELVFNFVRLDKFSDEGKILPTDVEYSEIIVDKAHLEYAFDKWGGRVEEFEGETENLFVVYTDDTVKFYDYYNRDIEVGDRMRAVSLYLPSVITHDPDYRTYPGRLYLPVPWKIIEKKDPTSFIINLENSAELIESEQKTGCQGNTIPVDINHNPKLKLIKDVKECLNE